MRTRPHKSSARSRKAFGTNGKCSHFHTHTTWMQSTIIKWVYGYDYYCMINILLPFSMSKSERCCAALSAPTDSRYPPLLVLLSPQSTMLHGLFPSLYKTRMQRAASSIIHDFSHLSYSVIHRLLHRCAYYIFCFLGCALQPAMGDSGCLVGSNTGEM